MKLSSLSVTFLAVVASSEAASCGDPLYNKCKLSDSDVRYDAEASNNLKDQDPIYEKLEGFWVGNYTFLTGEGITFPSSLYDETYGFGWPYKYGDYRGAINITIVGSRFYQHNYFFYPPASDSFCAENPNPEKGKSNVYGSGVCGVNGGFKSFDAFSTASHEKDGTMISMKGAGTYKDFVNTAYPIDRNTLLYTSTDNKTQFHSQTNVFFPDDNTRTRTAYGFDYAAPASSNPLMYSSLYREKKVSEEEWLQAIKEFKTMYNVPSEDTAPAPMQTSCLTGDWAGGVGVKCPTEEDFCEIDPNCSESPYKPEEPTLSAVQVSLLVAGLFTGLFIMFYIFYRLQRTKRERQMKLRILYVLAQNITIAPTAGKLNAEDLLKEFQHIDKNKDGKMSKDEMSDWIGDGKLGDISDKDFNLMWSVMDIDGDGEVDFVEFSAYLSSSDEAFEKVFNETEKMKKKMTNASGTLSKIHKTPEQMDTFAGDP